MSRTLSSPLHAELRAFIVERRKAKGLSQTDVARRVGRYQSYIANLETGMRRLDVVELMEIAVAIDFDPVDAILRLKAKSEAPNAATSE